MASCHNPRKYIVADVGSTHRVKVATWTKVLAHTTSPTVTIISSKLPERQKAGWLVGPWYGGSGDWIIHNFILAQTERSLRLKPPLAQMIPGPIRVPAATVASAVTEQEVSNLMQSSMQTGRQQTPRY